MNNEPIETQAVVVRETGGAVGQALGVNEILAQVRLIQSVMKSVMVENEHYGCIPGCGNKKTLLQPGAQKLTMTFRLAPEYQLQETDLSRGHKEYRVICTLKNINSGAFVGQGVGCCSTMESKYRWRGGARKCPQCGAESIIKGKKEYGGGWLCFGKKGGCGAKWEDGDAIIEGQQVDKVENHNPADHFNTVLKMAKKRAFVDATITATAASDIFTQDVGDAESDENTQEEPPKQPAKQPTPQRTQPVKTAPTQPQEVKKATTEQVLPPKEATEATKAWFLDQLRSVYSDEDIKTFFEKKAFIIPTEKIEDVPLRFVPISRDQMARFSAEMAVWEVGSPPASFDEEEPEFFKVVITIPRRGMKKVEYDKQPDTIGSLYRAMKAGDETAQSRLFGIAHNFEVKKTWTGNDNKEHARKPSEVLADEDLRTALNEFLSWAEERKEQGD